MAVGDVVVIGADNAVGTFTDASLADINFKEVKTGDHALKLVIAM